LAVELRARVWDSGSPLPLLLNRADFHATREFARRLKKPEPFDSGLGWGQ
jgi:hypothetical protein